MAQRASIQSGSPKIWVDEKRPVRGSRKYRAGASDPGTHAVEAEKELRKMIAYWDRADLHVRRRP